MGSRYQKSIKPGGTRSGLRKSSIGMLWARICTRIGIGPGEGKSTFNIPGTGAGYQTQSGFGDNDDARIARHLQSNEFNPMTGTYVTRHSGRPRRRKIWPWIVLAFAAIWIINYAFNQNDPVNTAPLGSPLVVEAMTNTSRPSDHAGQYAAATNTPVLTPRPSPSATITPVPSPTPTPEASSTMLKYGSKGEAVKNLQGQLIALGYMALDKDDGAFGDVTQAAVLSFQKENGLEADGIAGEKTLALIDSGTAKEDPDVFVWVVDKGKAYHSNKDCSNMKDPKQIKMSQAEKRKLTPCGNCH